MHVCGEKFDFFYKQLRRWREPPFQLLPYRTGRRGRFVRSERCSRLGGCVFAGNGLFFLQADLFVPNGTHGRKSEGR